MSVNVKSIDAIREFRASLLTFADEVRSSIGAVQADLARSQEWIEQDRPRYWTVQTQKAFDLVASTRMALNTCQMRTVAGRHPSCIEEKQAHEKAKRRLAQCQEQLVRVQRWSNKIRHDIDEFRGRMAGLQILLDAEIPRALALLESTAGILDQYAETPRPSIEQPKE